MTDTQAIRNIIEEITADEIGYDLLCEKLGEVDEFLDSIEETIEDNKELQADLKQSEDRIEELEKELEEKELGSVIETPMGKIHYDADNIFAQELMLKLSEIIYDKTEAGALAILESIRLATHTLP